MSKEQPIIALYELRIVVESDGILVQLFKTPVKFTGKNYVPQRITDELEKQDFNYFGLGCRVKADEIMKPRRTSLRDLTDHVGREIYFLEGHEDEAKALLKASVEEAITSMKKDMDAIHKVWQDKLMRPRRK